MKKIWFCKIGECEADALPDGADLPMRNAIYDAYARLTGASPRFIFSGWGAELDEGERAVVEDRMPAPAFYQEQRKRDAAPDLYEALRELDALEARELSAGVDSVMRPVTYMAYSAYDVQRIARAALAKACPTPATTAEDQS